MAILDSIQSIVDAKRQVQSRFTAYDDLKQALQQPILTDNWDLLFKYDIKKLVEYIQTVIKTMGSAGAALGVALGSAFAGAGQFLHAGSTLNQKAQSNSIVQNNLLKASGKSFQESFKSLQRLITSISKMFDQISEGVVWFTKTSPRFDEVNLPVYELKDDLFQMGNYRFNYAYDYEFKNLTFTFREDQMFPMYPFFENWMNITRDPISGTFHEASLHEIDMYFVLYGDYGIGQPYITYYMNGCHVVKITPNGTGSFVRDLDQAKPLTYKVECSVNHLQIVYNKISPVANILQGLKIIDSNSVNSITKFANII